MSLQTKHLYEFGPFRLDAAEHLLLRDGEAVPLTPKSFDLLLALVKRHGHLLEKDELMKLVWPDTFVEEANLSSNISLIRKALGDGENGQRFIETVPKRGYRFVADVREMCGSNGNLAEEVSPVESGGEMETVRATASAEHWLSKINLRKKGVIAAAAMLLVAVIGAVYLVPLIRHRLQAGRRLCCCR
ncbi:MAG: transcriptional regulator [Acidobacteria bacterium]|nr:transcriptional regulator [Acidobacteriota bacterium]